VSIRSFIALCIVGLGLALGASPALAQDAEDCFAAADRTKTSPLGDEDKQAAHQACLRALADSSNVVQKYHLQEADFDVMGTRPKP
jgi:hypothetical protein